MPADPRGLTPGLAQPTEPSEVFNMKCRRSSCDSMQASAIKIGDGSPQQSSRRMYTCVKCHHTWGLDVGGFVNI
jgi:curli biogenesis system outer membrane secretion channel CsgG